MVVRSTPHWQLDTCGFFAFFKKWEEFQCQWAQTYCGQLFDPLSFKVARVGEGLNMTTVVELLRTERNESWLEMVVKTVDRHLLLWLLFEERLEREGRLFGKAGLEREERGVERELELALEWGGYLSDSLQELSRGQSTIPQEE